MIDWSVSETVKSIYAFVRNANGATAAFNIFKHKFKTNASAHHNKSERLPLTDHVKNVMKSIHYHACSSVGEGWLSAAAAATMSRRFGIYYWCGNHWPWSWLFTKKPISNNFDYLACLSSCIGWRSTSTTIIYRCGHSERVVVGACVKHSTKIKTGKPVYDACCHLFWATSINGHTKGQTFVCR